MVDIDLLIDKTMETAMDRAIYFLDTEKSFRPFCFLIQKDTCLSLLMPNDTEFSFDESLMVDYFKDFAMQKLDENTAEGFCVVSITTTLIRGEETPAILMLFKFRNDTLPLGTRVYYFPYSFQNGKPFVDFHSVFASEG
ncbi:MAG: hypothetical protein Q4C75_04655 [Bergeyella zoohelcum]|nr:hypothetical protein [Bergeyella zoohelcum]